MQEGFHLSTLFIKIWYFLTFYNIFNVIGEIGTLSF